MLKIIAVYLVLLASILFPLTSFTQEPVSENSQTLKRTVVIEVVPFVKQKDEFCGPAAISAVMEFYGEKISQEEIAEQVYIPELNGALISDMENFAKNKGYKVESKNGDLESIKSLINENIPVILLVDRGKWKVSVPHYYVIYGYDENTNVFIHHKGFNSAQEINFSKLDKEWKKMNRLMLVVRK